MKPESTSTTPWAKICYGIDSSTSGTTAVRAERSGHKISFQTTPFDSKSVAQAVACGAAVASAMPIGKTIATRISAPFNSITKARRVFSTLLDIQLPFPLEDCLYNFTEITRKAKGVSPHIASSEGNSASTSTLAIAARKIDIEQRLTELDNIGIDPHVLDYEGVALWTQLLHEFPTQKTDAKEQLPLKTVIFLRGEEAVIVIGRGTEFLNAHKIKIEEPATLDRYLQAQFNKLELNKLSKRPDIEWFWAGADASHNKDISAFKSHISKRWMGHSTTITDPETFLARALATRALLPGPLRSNLRTDTLEHSGAQLHTRNRRTTSSIAILIAGIALCCASAGWKYSVAARHTTLEKQFNDRIKTIIGYYPKAKGHHALSSVVSEYEDRAKHAKQLTAIFDPSLLSGLQQIIAISNKQTINIEYLQLESDKLQIKGTSTIKDDIQALNNELSKIGYKPKITIDESKNGENHIFIINAILGDKE